VSPTGAAARLTPRGLTAPGFRRIVGWQALRTVVPVWVGGVRREVASRGLWHSRLMRRVRSVFFPCGGFGQSSLRTGRSRPKRGNPEASQGEYGPMSHPTAQVGYPNGVAPGDAVSRPRTLIITMGLAVLAAVASIIDQILFISGAHDIAVNGLNEVAGDSIAE